MHVQFKNDQPQGPGLSESWDSTSGPLLPVTALQTLADSDQPG
jgi:hypothetical protein